MFIIPKIKPSGCSCDKSIAVSSNDLAAYIVKNQPKKAAVTAPAIRNSIFHLLKGCNGKQATFSNRKRNTSHFSRSLFDGDVRRK